MDLGLSDLTLRLDCNVRVLSRGPRNIALNLELRTAFRGLLQP